MEREDLMNKLAECQECVQRIMAIASVSSQCDCIEPVDSCFILREIFDLSFNVSSIIIDLENFY